MRTGIWLLTLASLALGCCPRWSRARTALEEARYADALIELRKLESLAQGRSSRWQARYALERGVAHLALGDAEQAQYWLHRAWVWHDTDPSLYDTTELRRLIVAWGSLGHMPGDR